ncbi:hypothetical protein [Maricaulis sp.]|uniref:hypothetical protein n=1 Tax=Maricaulis sp. TaxID=1486257 RepID=UPI003A8D2C63
MIRLVAEAWLAVQGCWRILTFKDGWEENFDTSMGGLWHSFSAAIFALPLVALILLSAWHGSGGERGYGLEDFLVYSLSWVIFPLAASLAVSILGLRGRWAAWVVLHNWSSILLFAVQAGIWTLFLAGLINLQLLGILVGLYGYLRILVHWRIAYIALGAPTITSAAAAAIPILAAKIMVILISLAMTPAIPDAL